MKANHFYEDQIFIELEVLLTAFHLETGNKIVLHRIRKCNSNQVVVFRRYGWTNSNFKCIFDLNKSRAISMEAVFHIVKYRIAIYHLLGYAC